MNMDLLIDSIGYRFQNASLLLHALTHSSYANEKHMPKEKNNQRLEFLGDAVLELVSSEYIYKHNPEMPEGQMTRLRASLVCEPTLAACARELSLEDYILLGKGEGREGINYKDSVLSDTFEAVIGAIYLDGGFEPAQRFIERRLLSDIENKQLFHDSKTLLQEYTSKQGLSLHYALLEEKGPEHQKSFVLAACISDEEYGRGEGHSKKQAEQIAAYNALLKIKAENSTCI